MGNFLCISLKFIVILLCGLVKSTKVKLTSIFYSLAKLPIIRRSFSFPLGLSRTCLKRHAKVVSLVHPCFQPVCGA